MSALYLTTPGGLRGAGVLARRALCAASLLCLLGPLPVRAQAPAPSKPLRFTADLGFVSTGGNTDLVTVSIAERVDWAATNRLSLRQTIRWVFGETDGEKSANQLQAGVRSDVVLTDGLSAYGGASYDYDLFAGIKRRFQELVGLGYQPLDTEHHKLKFEGGVTFFQETSIADEEERFVAGRGAADYRFLFGSKAYFQQAVEMLPNLDNLGDYRLNSEASLVAPLNSALAIKLSYQVRYRAEPPEGFGSTDTTFRSGIQVTL